MVMLQKVVEMTNGILQKGKREKREEQVQFVACKQLKNDTTAEKKRATDQVFNRDCRT